MKGVLTDKNRLRHAVFTDVARLAYAGGGPDSFDELADKIIKETGAEAEAAGLDSEIVRGRLRAAMGMTLAMMPAVTQKAQAESVISYKECRWEDGSVKSSVKDCNNYTTLSSNSSSYTELEKGLV